MRGFGLVSWGREFRKTGSLPDPSPREQHDGTANPGRRFALPWAISFCPFGADGWGAALVLPFRRLTHDGKEVPPSGLKMNGVELKAERRKPSGEKHCDIEDIPSLTGVLAHFRLH
jgi:hypothetical protein